MGRKQTNPTAIKRNAIFRFLRRRKNTHTASIPYQRKRTHVGLPRIATVPGISATTAVSRLIAAKPKCAVPETNRPICIQICAAKAPKN
ncbi:MAG: hypothetical protein II553_01735, partial [Lachnospiraceae bacterium]|nr:hypothetical protein [Lachnospiraceae bacterium]